MGLKGGLEPIAADKKETVTVIDKEAGTLEVETVDTVTVRLGKVELEAERHGLSSILDNMNQQIVTISERIAYIDGKLELLK